jgi:Subtilase family
MPSARSTLVVGVLVACAAAFTPVVASAATTSAPATGTTGAPSTGNLPRGSELQPVCGGQFVALSCASDRIVVPHGSGRAAFASTSPVGWGAIDLEHAHQLPTLLPSHDTIGIIDLGADPQLESDLGTYRAQYGLPACTTANGCFQQIDYHGGPALPPATTDENKAIDEEIATETSLDVDMASAACPHCNIVEVQIPDSEIPSEPTDPTQPIDFDGYAQAFGVAVQTAITHGVDSISMSYGIPGDAAMLTGTIASDLDHKGVAISASSGDGGFAGNGWVWPSALPTVTAVGGTELVEESGLYAEGAWTYAGSDCVPTGTPAVGQPASVSALCGGGRATSDISAVADDIAVYDSYTPSSGLKLGWQVLAGTSASSPFVAGVIALGPVPVRYATARRFYARPTSLRDVVDGSNGFCGGDYLCTGLKGYDGPTGMGSPRGTGAL